MHGSRPDTASSSALSHRYSRTFRKDFSLMAQQPTCMANSRVAQARMAVNDCDTHSCRMMGTLCHCQAGTCMRRRVASVAPSQPHTAAIGAATIFAHLQQKQGSHSPGNGGMTDKYVPTPSSQTHTAPPQHAHLPPGQPSEQQGPYI